jgi:NADH-quinone oxidoreductase subunit N
MTTVQAVDVLRLLPEIILSAFAILVMVLDPFVKIRKSSLGWLALVGVIGAALGVAGMGMVWTYQALGNSFRDSFVVDPFSLYFISIFLLVAALTILGSLRYLEREKVNYGEYYALILMATVGACFMASSTELIMIFIGLEISSISTYILAGFKRHDAQSNEASLKYFLLGSFATAFFLYGVAFVYGLTGTTNLIAIANQDFPGSLVKDVGGSGVPVNGGLAATSHFLWIAVILMFVGIAFKSSTAPFQIWTPDVYQGAPAPVSALLSTGPKAAAFAIFLRIFLGGMANAGSVTFWVVWASALLTMCLGNLGALFQSNVKRLLGYSSIAHAGYVLVGIAAALRLGEDEGSASVLFYLVAYALMNVGAFVLVAHLAGTGERATSIDDYTGLGYARPGVAAVLSVLLLSLAGLPITAGFFAKFYVFRAAIHAHLIGLTIVAVLNSVVSWYYYLKIVMAMYMREGQTAAATSAVPRPLGAALFVCVVGILFLGLFPNLVLDLANLSARPLP